MKRIEDITVLDLQQHPIWEYVDRSESREVLVRPVTQMPCSDLGSRVVGTEVLLACGQRVWALIGNVDLQDPRSTEQFLSLSLEKGGKWVHLARYFDVDYPTRGPDALADFLGLRTEDVFPIHYNISPVASGHPAALVAEVPKEPRERLSRAELLAFAVR